MHGDDEINRVIGIRKLVESTLFDNGPFHVQCFAIEQFSCRGDARAARPPDMHEEIRLTDQFEYDLSIFAADDRANTSRHVRHAYDVAHECGPDMFMFIRDGGRDENGRRCDHGADQAQRQGHISTKVVSHDWLRSTHDWPSGEFLLASLRC